MGSGGQEEVFFGIDFGTTNRTIAMLQPGKELQLARFSFGGEEMPACASVLYFEQSKSASGQRREHVLVYSQDHGDYLMDYGLCRKGVGMPESLTRIPMVWAGPGIKSSNAGMSAFVSMVGFFPTLCAAMGVDIPRGVQGRSLWPILEGQGYSRDEFRSIYCTVGLGLYYEPADDVPYFCRTGSARRCKSCIRNLWVRRT